MDEPDERDRDRGGNRDVEREQPPRNRRHTDRRPDEGGEKKDPSRTDDERIDEASDESFPASDPPQQP